MPQPDPDLGDRIAEASVEFFGKIGEGTIVALGQVVNSIITAVGRVAEGIATNPNPISQVVSIALAIITIDFFITTEPYKTLLKKMGLDVLLNTWSTYMVGLADFTTKELGRDDATGIYGIAIIDFNGNLVTSRGLRWYTNTLSRDAALVFLHAPGFGIAIGDLAPNGPGSDYVKTQRHFTGTAPGSWVFDTGQPGAFFSGTGPGTSIGTAIGTKGTGPYLVGREVSDGAWIIITPFPNGVDWVTVKTSQVNPAFYPGTVQVVYQ